MLERVGGLVDTLQPEDALSRFGNWRSAKNWYAPVRGARRPSTVNPDRSRTGKGSARSSFGASFGGQINCPVVILGPVDIDLHPGIVHFTKGDFSGHGHEKVLQGRCR